MGTYNFLMAAMVIDENGKASAHLNNNYDLTWVPTIYFDAGSRVYVGTSQSSISSRIIQAGALTVNDVDLSISVAWLGGAQVEVTVTVVNNQFFNTLPEDPPMPTGPTIGITDGVYDVSARGGDPDDQDLWYMFDWNDGTFSEWLGPYPSGDEMSAGHAWSTTGTHYYRVKVKDTYDGESGWSAHQSINIVQRGDANSDNTLNVGDAVFLINYAFKGGPASNPVERGDANCDQSVNVGDAVYMINYAFKGGPPPVCSE